MMEYLFPVAMIVVAFVYFGNGLRKIIRKKSNDKALVAEMNRMLEIEIQYRNEKRAGILEFERVKKENNKIRRQQVLQQIEMDDTAELNDISEPESTQSKASTLNQPLLEEREELLIKEKEAREIQRLVELAEQKGMEKQVELYKQKGREKEIEIRKTKEKAAKIQIEWTRERKKRKEYQKEIAKYKERDNEVERAGLKGFIVSNVSEEFKPTLRDLILGFEKYAKLKGYNATVDFDTSMAEKLAYRITVDEECVEKSVDAMMEDLNEYMREAQSGESKFKGLPRIIARDEHDRIVESLRIRTEDLEKQFAWRDKYSDKMFKQIKPQTLKIENHIQTGENNMRDNKSNTVTNSAGVVQGDNNDTVIEGNSIYIGNDSSDRSAIISKLDALLAAIENDNVYSNATRYIENVKEELTDAEEPDRSRIEQWLSKAKSVLSIAETGGEIFQKAQDAYTALGQPSL